MLKALKITLLSILILMLVGIMVSFMTGNFSFKNVKGKLIYNETYEVDEVKDFIIDVRSEDVEIYESEDEKINVKVYARDKKNISLTKDDENNIKIKQKKGSVCVGFCFSTNNVIKVYLPKEYIGKFDVTATSGDINSEVENNLDYKVKITSGDITLLNANSLSGKATSGDVEIENLNSYIDYKATSGDIEISTFNIGKNSKIIVTSGDIEIDKLSDAYVSTKVTSGDVKVKKNNRYATYELYIKATSGDISVN